MRKKDVFRLLDTQMADPQAAEAIKEYIDNLVQKRQGATNGRKTASAKQ